MNRRAFLARLAGVVAAAVVGPTVLKALPAPRMMFHPDVMAGLFNPSAAVAAQFRSVRFIEQYDIANLGLTRYDVLYGIRTFTPDEAAANRVWEP